jgi:cytochrome P450
VSAPVTLLDLPDLEPALEAATASAPLWRCARTGIWVAETHALVNAVLTNPADFSSKVTLTGLDAGFPGGEVEAIYRAGGAPWTRTLQTNDPPDHRRFRALVERVFTPSKVEGMAEGIARHCAQLLEAWTRGVRVDAMDAFAIPLPLLVIAEQLGVPAEDRAHFKRWSDAAIQAIGLGATREEHLEAARCGVEFQQYFTPILADPQRRPDGSLVDRVALAAAQPDTPLTLPEQLSLLHMLMIAGHETTTSTLGSLLVLLADRPDLAAAARSDARLQKRLIEEVLRLAARFRACSASRRANSSSAASCCRRARGSACGSAPRIATWRGFRPVTRPRSTARWRRIWRSAPASTTASAHRSRGANSRSRSKRCCSASRASRSRPTPGRCAGRAAS